MSILSGFKKVRRRIRLPDGYKLVSFWTSSQTVEMDDGTTLESNKVKWDDASTKKHEHTNKDTLDSITSEKVAKWNTLAESNVTGVKGNTESSYRTGNVNLTSANIGALPITGGSLTGNIYPATNNSSSVGTSSYKWANMYATTFHGALDGKSNCLKLNRVTKSASYNPGTNSFVVEEFTDGSTNIPTSHYYHILSSQGADANYVTQLALGMTVDEVKYRNKKAGTWGNWVTLLNSGNFSNFAVSKGWSIKQVIGTKELDISSIVSNTKNSEIVVELVCGGTSHSAPDYTYTWTVIPAFLSTYKKHLVSGYKYNNYEGFAEVMITKSTIKVLNCVVGNISYINDCSLRLLYR